MGTVIEIFLWCPTYVEWLKTADQGPAYQELKTQLKLLQWQDASRRGKKWILKSPTHMSAPKTLLDTFPDALIIQTHRDPLKSIPSHCSMNAMIIRMKSDVIDARPAAVVILGGSFDLARNVPLTTIQGNFTAMADLAEANNIRPMFASVLPVSDYHKDANPTYERTPGRPLAQVRALNEWLQSFCVRRGYSYLNYFAVVVDAKGQLREDFSDDGLHPNSKGYRIMAPLVLDALEKSGPPPAASAKPNRKR